MKELLVVLTFHSIENLNETFEMLHQLDNIEYLNFDIAIVNSGHHGMNGDEFKAKNHRVIYFYSVHNVGFARANNIALEYGINNKYNFFLILNSDVLVDNSFIFFLHQEFLKNNRLGLAGPRIFLYNNKNKLWAQGGYIIKWRAIIGGLEEDRRRTGEYIKWRSILRQMSVLKGDDLDYLPGACIMIKREVVERVGLLPDCYFFAYEEAEFALKVKKIGFQLKVVNDSVIWHKVGATLSKKPEFVYNSYRNRFLFLFRTHYFPFNVILVLNLCLIKLLQKNSNKKLCLLALRDHFKYKCIKEEHLLRIKAMFPS
jgi:GT2 family glycosyltransferase